MERYIGKTLDNRYEILEIIGTGGMSVVFKAKCHRLNRLVAVKMLKKDLSEDAEFRRKFHDESQAVAMLSHPNIMAVYDVSRGGDMDYIVMELLDGITLKQYMERRGKLDWRETLHFITQIMRGLSHAHSRNLIHRDIKPQNIMVLRDGTVKVTDFGIACLSNGTNPSNEAIGSVHYISPEQAKGDYTDNRSDIYSAGVVMYEMLSGQLPFAGENPLSVAIQHFSAIPLRPREINSEIPEALEQICMKAMAADRKKRYATADEMIADLEAFRKDPSVSFDYSVEDLRVRTGDSEEEPTRPIPNVSAARSKPTQKAKPVNENEEKERMYEEKGSRHVWVGLVISLLVTALVLVLGYYAISYGMKFFNEVKNGIQSSEAPKEYVVPNLLGMTLEEAREHPEIKGIFEVKNVYSQNSTEYEEGQIMAQDPVGGRTKKPGEEGLIPIIVTVSLGPTSGKMPDLVGEDKRSAEMILQRSKELSKLGLDIQIVPDYEYHPEIPAGHIMQTEPEAGAILRENNVVILYLSRGPEIIYRTMIPCVGASMEWVQLQMESMNLIAEFEPVESDKPVGTVLSQSVETSTEIAEGSTVVFTYSSGPKQTKQVIRYNLNGEVDYEVLVIIYLDDTIVLESELPGDYGMLEVEVEATAGVHTYRVYVDYVLKEQGEITFG